MVNERSHIISAVVLHRPGVLQRVAGLFTRRLWQVMLAGVGLSMLLATGGLALSYGPDLPSGATVILLAAAAYLAALALRWGIGILQGRRRPP